MEKKKLGIIGGGTMAYAIAAGALAKNYLKAEQIIVSEPDAEKRGRFEACGIYAVSDNVRAAENCEYLLFCIKPQTFSAVAAELRGRHLPALISVMAGRTVSGICAALGDSALSVARAMPNLPCSEGAGATAVAFYGCSREEKGFVLGLFSAVGAVLEIEEENLNAVTALSGSGPAYFFLFLQALVRAGVQEGLSLEQSKRLALQTCKGGIAMVERGVPTETLIASVTSKGGTTAAAMERFKQEDFEGCIARAVRAAARRAEELSE